jgi:adenine-specific DNA-methyltransferase
MIYRRASTAVTRALNSDQSASLLNGNCMDLLGALPSDSISLTISSPPYCMGKEYEEGNRIEDFVAAHELVLPEVLRVTRPGGSICWQVGYHVRDNDLTPLDYLVFDVMRRHCRDVVLRNRIAWTFGHGRHGIKRFSGRHEMILWFTKGEGYEFDLDAVRVPQKYPGKRATRGPRKGEYSGNPNGKNPSDVWNVPNVKAKHVEKTDHPCQFPVALPQRLIKALSRTGDVVLDPFAGVASTGVAAIVEGRRFLGAELNESYCAIAKTRLADALRGEAKVRPLEQEVHIPDPTSAVAKRPDHFWTSRQNASTQSLQSSD